MKQIRLFFLALMLFGTGVGLRAQDIHYSLYNMSPLTLNPALTGAFYGSIRVGGIYRDQWFSYAGSDGYVTPSAYIDSPILRGLRDQDWIGVGGMFFQDKAGIGRLRTTASKLSLAYHLGLDKKAKSVLTIGLQGGGVQRRVNTEDLLFGDDFINGAWANTSNEPIVSSAAPDPDNPDGREIKADYLDFAAGLMLRSNINEKSRFEIGLAVNHLTQPNEGFRNSGTGGGGNNNVDDALRRPMTILAHTRYETALNEKVSFAPTAFFQTTRGATEFAVQAWGGYMLDPTNPTKLNFGLGYRVGDAAQVLLGIDYKDLRVALSYDVTFSQLRNANSYQGGLELAAWYIFKIYKKPDITPTILCPHF